MSCEENDYYMCDTCPARWGYNRYALGGFGTIKYQAEKEKLDELFQITAIDVISNNEKALTDALRNINVVLIENGITRLQISNLNDLQSIIHI